MAVQSDGPACPVYRVPGMSYHCLVPWSLPAVRSVCPAPPPDFKLGNGTNEHRVRNFPTRDGSGNFQLPLTDTDQLALYLIVVREGHPNLAAEPYVGAVNGLHIPLHNIRIFRRYDRFKSFRSNILGHWQGFSQIHAGHLRTVIGYLPGFI